MKVVTFPAVHYNQSALELVADNIFDVGTGYIN